MHIHREAVVPASLDETFSVDRQGRGPYRIWVHEHRFEAVDGGTRVIDHVDYVPRLRWLTSALVRRDVERIFDYRQQALAESFAR